MRSFKTIRSVSIDRIDDENFVLRKDDTSPEDKTESNDDYIDADAGADADDVNDDSVDEKVAGGSEIQSFSGTVSRFSIFKMLMIFFSDAAVYRKQKRLIL